MKFFLDANFSNSTLKIFEDLHFEAIHARHIGLETASDDEIFSYAAKNKCILVTKDLEFGNPNSFQLKDIEGLIIVRVPFYFTAGQINAVLMDFLNTIDITELSNNLTILKLGRYRMRKIK